MFSLMASGIDLECRRASTTINDEEVSCFYSDDSPTPKYSTCKAEDAPAPETRLTSATGSGVRMKKIAANAILQASPFLKG
ncbi:hypothetical protein E3N88_06706 [Mikania micrantha]|uniref:Uncharacterized protein n=1 Tax=Mikania micrantha TaxID=192012 RepID=A0A5N6PRW6_9ASTR|nr:hypothetical protein E3N88_06706 [Mikania micrantha]